MPESRTAEPVTRVMSLPPEPFSQLVPGTRIEEGDICWNPDDPADEWTKVPEVEWGSKVPDTTRSYARLIAPEGYQILPGNAQIRIRDVAWRTREPKWSPVIMDWPNLGTSAVENATVDDFATLYPDETAYVARPDAATPDHVTIPIPPHHRDLAAGESVRRGDRMICEGMDAWETVSERVRGSEVQEPASPNKFVRYCRPISPQAGHWYVDLRAGKGTDTVTGSKDKTVDDLSGFGSASNPFASLEGAQRIIEMAATKADQPVFGVIWEVRGVPLFAYDIPEPPPAPPLHERVQMPVPVASQPDHSVKPCEPVEWPVTQSKDDFLLKALDQIDMAKFYVLSPSDQIEKGDMLYGSVGVEGDVWAWQQAPEQLVRNDDVVVGDTRLMVRRRAPTNHRDLLKSLSDEAITAAEQALAKARQLREVLDEEN